MRIRHTFVLVLALAFAACSSGGTAPKQAAVSSADAGGDSGLVAKAQTAVLQPTDFPPGWKVVPEEDGGGLHIERLWGELTQCLGVDGGADRAGLATSPTFLRDLATQARATVEYTSPASAGAIGAALKGPKFSGCARSAFDADVKRSAPEGATPRPVAVAAVDAPPPAPQSFSYRVTTTLELDDLTVPLFQDFLVVVNGGTVIRMLFLNPGSQFPPDLERSLVEKVVGRA